MKSFEVSKLHDLALDFSIRYEIRQTITNTQFCGFELSGHLGIRGLTAKWIESQGNGMVVPMLE